MRASNLVALCSCLVITAASKGWAATDTSTFPLNQAMVETQDVLDQYEATKGNLPDVTSAAFDFKTVTTGTVGISVNLLIFTIGGQRQDSTTSDVEFLYKPHKDQPKPETQLGPQVMSMFSLDDHDKKKPPVAKFEPMVMATLQAAASAAAAKLPVPKDTTLQKPLEFCSLTTTIGFGVTWDGKAGANGPIGTLVVASLTADKNKNATQTVKLTFANNNATCK